MGINIAKWFKRKNTPLEENTNDILYLMSKINGTTSDEVTSILVSSSNSNELKKLYKDMYEYVLNAKKNNKVSLINNRYVLEAINANIDNYDLVSKIFSFVKSWDKDAYLPKGIAVILKNQLSLQDIKDLEDLYKDFNLMKKDKLKDEKYYYYVNSKEIKNRLTEAFGNYHKSWLIMMKTRDLDNGRKISKELIAKLGNMFYKKNEEGTRLNSIRLYKVRDVNNYDVINNEYLNSSFTKGMIDSGNILYESNTTIVTKSMYDVLMALKDNDDSYSGVLVIEIPRIYFDSDGYIINEYLDKVYKDSNYQIIDNNYLSMYVALNDKRCEHYNKNEFLNKTMDLPRKK